MLDVDVNVRQYCATVATRSAALVAPTPEQTWTIREIAEEFDVTHRTVRHYEELGLITPERRGRPGSTTAATGPASGSSCAASASASRSRRSARSSTSTTHPEGVAASSSTSSAQIDERRADLEQRRRDLEDALTELDRFEDRCREDLSRHSS